MVPGVGSRRRELRQQSLPAPGASCYNASILSRVVAGFAGRPNVRRYKVRFSTRARPGDDVICQGKVTRKLEQGGEKLVEGDLQAVNQKGETLLSGSFTAALPSRG